jgi:DNA-directed RNA polymerase specialized sigma24 family protein
MSLTHPALDRLVRQDTLAQALSLMRPRELVVAALRADGLTDRQIAVLLGITHKAFHARMMRARQRIAKDLPELRVVLEGRRSPHKRGEAHLTGQAGPPGASQGQRGCS